MHPFLTQGFFFFYFLSCEARWLLLDPNYCLPNLTIWWRASVSQPPSIHLILFGSSVLVFTYHCGQERRVLIYKGWMHTWWEEDIRAFWPDGWKKQDVISSSPFPFLKLNRLFYSNTHLSHCIRVIFIFPLGYDLLKTRKSVFLSSFSQNQHRLISHRVSSQKRLMKWRINMVSGSMKSVWILKSSFCWHLQNRVVFPTLYYNYFISKSQFLQLFHLKDSTDYFWENLVVSA